MDCYDKDFTVLRFAFLVLFTCVASASAAATLTASDNPNCAARFEGVVQPGDAEVFRDTAARLLQPDPGDPEGNTYFLRICLDSPGGSLLEATRIAEIVAETGYGTVIDDGDRCVSACAVIFMFGSQYYTGRTVSFNRRLHVGGTLGFHRPDFALPEGGNYKSSDVERAFDIAILATLEFVRLANRRIEDEVQTYVPSDLIEQMFEREGEDYFYVDTVNKAGRWEIEIFGFAQPTAVSARDAITACHNLANWTYRLSPEPVRIPRDHMGYWIRDVQRVVHMVDEPELTYDDNPQHAYLVKTGPDYVNDRFLAQEDRTCLINLRVYDGELILSACGGNNSMTKAAPVFSQCGISDDDAMQAAMPLAAYPSDLPLTGISAWSAIMSAEAAEIDAMDDGGPRAWCRRLPGDYTRVVNVKEYVNIRETPGFDAPVVAKAGRHLVLRYGERPVTLWGDSATRERCEAACVSMFQAGVRDDSVRNPVLQCMNDNVVWFDVEMPNGKRGWVSAKYTDF